MEAASRVMEHATRKMEEASRAAAMVAEEPPRKRLLTTEEERLISHVGMPSTHIKITSRSKFLTLDPFFWVVILDSHLKGLGN